MPNSFGIIPNRPNFAIIPLPEKSPIYKDSVFTVTKNINGLLGGVITLNKSYTSIGGGTVNILVEMVILPASFFGQREITLTIDDSLAIMHCEPSMNFLLPVVVLQTFTGLDLATYNTNDIDYGYIGYNGNFELIPRDIILVNKLLGTVTVVGAKINHFSRYGWVRKHGNSN